MDKETLVRDLFPPYVPSTQEVLDRLIADRIRPLEQSLADRRANVEAELAADQAKLDELLATADQLQAELSMPVPETPVEEAPAAEEVAQ